MKKNIFTFLFFLFFTFNISAEKIYLTCDGGSDYAAAFRWIELDKEQKSIIFTGTWGNVEIDEKTYEQKWYEASGYSEDLMSIYFKFKKTDFSIDRENLILKEKANGEYGFSPLAFKCNINDSFNAQNEHRINYWKARLKKNKI